MGINYHEISLEDVSRRILTVLNRVPSLKIALLFGSASRRMIARDVDVGVVMEPELDLKSLIALANKLEDMLGIPVDLVPLRKASPKLKLKALLEGFKVIVRDPGLYASLLSEALSEVMDLDLKLRGARSR
ncbi:MAG: nucleotidyltransferase domain-containing protein [Candidatus Bathyarchaeia archaeon]